MENKNLIKNRDKEIEKLDISKIREALQWANRGLNLNLFELESQIDSIYRPGVSTKDIQMSLIDLALRMTTVYNPEWRFLAARLLLMDFYKEAAKTRGYSEFGYGDYIEFLDQAVKKGLYDGELLKRYSIEELRIASTFINPDYDLDFDYAGMSMMINRYLIKDRLNAFELPQELFLTVALWLSVNENRENRLEVVKNIYNLVASRKISLATPILLNLRRINGNLSSCFITAVDDDLDSIFDNVTKIARISKNGGGVGVNLSRVRASGSEINKTPGASGGVIPWIRIINDTAVAVNQLGKRAGAVTVALDIWHYDVLEFLEMQTENGDQRKKAYDIFPQLVINDLFMNRVKQNKGWTLFDPNEIKLKYGVNIAQLWGEEFEEFYKKIEKESILKLRKDVDAKNLLLNIMKVQVETGMPYIFFKDTANRTNPNQHDGFVGSGNLCQESFSNFRPSRITKKIENGKIVEIKEDGLVHTCNLVSINLSNVDDSQLEEVCKYSVRVLDNAIDLTITPIGESDLHNQRYRTIGVGAMGLADYLAKRDINYVKSEKVVDELFEKIALYSVKASVELAKSRGAYSQYEGSEWSKGIVFGKDADYLEKHSNNYWQWKIVLDDMKKYGIRNGQILAIAPNTSSSLLQGCSASVLPIFSKFYVDKNTKGTMPVCPPYIKEKFWFYQENKNIDQRVVTKIIATIQKWVDQGISMELVYNLNSNIKAKDIYETIFSAWENGCKTIYYTRIIQKNSNVTVSGESCVACAN